MALENFVNGEKLNLFAKELKKNIKNDLLGDKRLRYVTQEEYDALTDDQKNDENIVWNITDPDIVDVATKEYVDNAIAGSSKVVMLTQAEYNALGDSIDPGTLYIIG